MLELRDFINFSEEVMKKILVGLVFGLSFTAQASMMCTVAEKGLELGSEAIATTFKCENPGAILKDLRTFTKIEDHCSTANESALTCKLISKSVSTIVADKIPAQWECDAEHSEDTIEGLVFASCEYLARQL